MLELVQHELEGHSKEACCNGGGLKSLWQEDDGWPWAHGKKGDHHEHRADACFELIAEAIVDAAVRQCRKRCDHIAR